MENSESLDRLIKEYSGQLMKTYEKRNPYLKEEKEVLPIIEEAFAEAQEAESEDEENEVTEKEETDLTDNASFFATVRSGGGAFPVPNAKIIIGRDDTVVSFLVTDENGETPKVFLPAYNEKDSLSNETAKVVNYYADVYATGFQTKRNLPVIASGGAEIVLNIELTPDEERVE